MRKMGILSVALFLATCSIPAWAQVTFDKVQIRTNFLEAEEGDKGKLVINSERIQFTKKDGVTEYFSIPAKAVTEVLYSSISGRRKGTFLLTKVRKHYMALSFNDGADLVGKVEFKLHKSNYQSVLGTVEEVTGRTVASQEEGVEDTEQTVASQEESVTDTEQTVASREESVKETKQTVTSQEGGVKDTKQTVASQEDDRSGDMQAEMSSVLRPVRKRKKGRTLGPVKIIRREDYSDLELDAKVELIRSLGPLGLMHVEELLDEEVTALAGERYARKDASVGGRRHGSNPGTVGLAGQRTPLLWRS